MTRAWLDRVSAALVLAFVVGAMLGAMLLLFGCENPTYTNYNPDLQNAIQRDPDGGVGVVRRGLGKETE